MLKKLRSFFIVDDGTAKTEKQSPQTAQSEEAPINESIEQPDSQSRVPVDYSNQKPDKKFVDVLLKAIEANNLEGFDYLEFKQALQNLSNVDMDEGTRYQSALAMAKTMGASPTNLKQSAQHYIKVLRKEEVKFLDAVKNQRARQIGDREKRLVNLEKLIKEKESKIAKLRQEIETHKKELGNARGDINKATAKVDATQGGFIAAYKSVVGQIQSDIAKMDAHLK